MRCIDVPTLEDAISHIRWVEREDGDCGSLHTTIGDGNLENCHLADARRYIKAESWGHIAYDAVALSWAHRERVANLLCLSVLEQISEEQRYDAWEQATGCSEN
jgi:hypothetical protein